MQTAPPSAGTPAARVAARVGGDVCAFELPTAIVQAYPSEKRQHALHAIAEGLTACGYYVRRVGSGDDINVDQPPELIVTWNGRRDLTWRHAADRFGCPILFCEHGFFDRNNYTQVDHAGFLHTASWAKHIPYRWDIPTIERFQQFYPNPIVPQQNKNGPIIVLGQVPGDTQLLDSEISNPLELQQLIVDALAQIPNAPKAYFRPHPIAGHHAAHRQWRTLPELPVQANEREHYLRSQAGLSLKDALAGARFVVAINSNALNDAMLLGIPCMAFGPCIGIDADVIHKATVATLVDDLRHMIAGWKPTAHRVLSYLGRLAMRQWSAKELRDPETLRPLIAAAKASVAA